MAWKDHNVSNEQNTSIFRDDICNSKVMGSPQTPQEYNLEGCTIHSRHQDIVKFSTYAHNSLLKSVSRGTRLSFHMHGSLKLQTHAL